MAPFGGHWRPHGHLSRAYSQQQVDELMVLCWVFVYAGLEGLGIDSVHQRPERFFCGLGRGGLLDALRSTSAGMRELAWVVPGQSMESLVQAMGWFEQERIWRSLDAEFIPAWAEQFRPKAFAVRFESAREQPAVPISGAVPL